jgi:hypothetical protein
MAVTRVNVSIPLRTTNEHGFFIHRETPQRQLLGYVVQMRVQQPYAYLELRGVPSELAPDLLNRVRAIVPWAALRLDFGIRAAGGKSDNNWRRPPCAAFATIDGHIFSITSVDNSTERRASAAIASLRPCSIGVAT